MEHFEAIETEERIFGSKILELLWGGRVQSMSCSKNCNCRDNCCNMPFRKERRLKVVKVCPSF